MLGLSKTITFTTVYIVVENKLKKQYPYKLLYILVLETRENNQSDGVYFVQSFAIKMFPTQRLFFLYLYKPISCT